MNSINKGEESITNAVGIIPITMGKVRRPTALSPFRHPNACGSCFNSPGMILLASSFTTGGLPDNFLIFNPSVPFFLYLLLHLNTASMQTCSVSAILLYCHTFIPHQYCQGSCMFKLILCTMQEVLELLNLLMR